MDHHPRKPHLLSLPLDIKLMIYRLLFVELSVHLCLNHPTTWWDFPEPRQVLSILNCCTQIREEALPRFYALARFRLDGQAYKVPYTHSQWCYQPVPHSLRQIRKAYAKNLHDVLKIALPSVCDRKIMGLPYEQKWLKFRELYPAIRDIHLTGWWAREDLPELKVIYNNKDSVKVTLGVRCGPGLRVSFTLFPDRTVMLEDRYYSTFEGHDREWLLRDLEIALQELGLSLSEVTIVQERSSR